MSTFLYGRRMYERMTAYWPTAESDPAATQVMVDFARIWKDTPKVVFSTTLETVDWNSRLVRDRAVEEVARLKAQPGADMDVGGPTIAASPNSFRRDAPRARRRRSMRRLRSTAPSAAR